MGFLVNEDLNEKIKRPFVFISWKHDNNGTFRLLSELVGFLESNGVNVVWDNGGLAANERVERFQQLIFASMCYKVLVISTKEYLDSIDDMTTGAGKEYNYIAEHYTENPKKYQAIVINGKGKLVCPLLAGGIYLNINDYDAIKKACSLSDGDRYSDPDYNALMNVFLKIDIAMDEFQYRYALELSDSIRHEIENFDVNKRTRCSYLNARLVCYLYGVEYSEALEDANELYKLAHSSNYLSKTTQATCLLNCSKVFHELGDKKYLSAAEDASDRATKNGLQDAYDYMRNYAVFLYEDDRMIESAKVMTESYKYFVEAFKNKTMTDADICNFIKTCETHVACNVGAAKRYKRNDRMRLRLLREAEKHVLPTLLEYPVYDYLSDEDAETVYETMQSLYECLYTYFS